MKLKFLNENLIDEKSIIKILKDYIDISRKPKLGSVFLTRDGTFINLGENEDDSHGDIISYLENEDIFIFDDHWQFSENFGYIRMNSGTTTDFNAYIEFLEDKPTSEQYDGIENWLYYVLNSGVKEVEINVPNNKSIRYSLIDYLPDDIIKKVKRYYSSGNLYESSYDNGKYKLEESLTEDLNSMLPYYKNLQNEDRTYLLSFLSKDPTWNEKKESGQYSKWILDKLNRKIIDKSILGHLGDLLKRFEDNKKQLKDKDINKFKTPEDLENYLNDDNNYTNLSHRQEVRQRQKDRRNADLNNEADLIYEDDDWEVWVPKTYAASCKLGQDTKWCTASTETDSYYNRYTKKGNLYININKHNIEEKYQFHFQSNSFMDKDDKEIDIEEFFINNPILYEKVYSRKYKFDIDDAMQQLSKLEKNNYIYYYDGEEISKFIRSKVKEVIISNSVESIDNNAFSGCSSLTSITIDNSVISVGSGAFKYCISLTKVNYNGTIDQWVQIKFDSIDANPIYYAKNLYINDTLVKNANITTSTKINAYALCDCDSIESITIGKRVTSIGNGAFRECTNLKSVVIGDSVESIGVYAFAYSNPTIYCEATKQPSGWDISWNGSRYRCPVVWGYKSNKTNESFQKLMSTQYKLKESLSESSQMDTLEPIVQDIYDAFDEHDIDGNNQNCMLCTWATELQLRGEDILPRPVYSPRDIIFSGKFKGEDIVVNPQKLSIEDKEYVINKVQSAGNGSRFYCHVNWNDSDGGHEFLLVNIDDEIYIVDSQSNYIELIEEDDKYFNDINFKNSYIVRLDDKDINQEILKYNDFDYVVEWDEEIDSKMLEENYDPPYNAQQIKDNYGIELYNKLIKDPAHRWRMETGIELIHKEPTNEELERIWKNWQEMSKEQKEKSDKKSLELFGKTNEENYYDLIKLYESIDSNKNIDEIETPEQLMNWMEENITYELANDEYGAEDDPPTKTAEEVIESGTGHCAEQSYLEYRILDELGYFPQLVFVKENNSKKDYGADGSAHMFVVYQDDDEKYTYFEHSQEHSKGIHKFDSMSELLDFVGKNWWRYDADSDILEVRYIDEPITGVNNWELAQECHKYPVDEVLDISNNVMEDEVPQDARWDYNKHKIIKEKWEIADMEQDDPVEADVFVSDDVRDIIREIKGSSHWEYYKFVLDENKGLYIMLDPFYTIHDDAFDFVVENYWYPELKNMSDCYSYKEKHWNKKLIYVMVTFGVDKDGLPKDLGQDFFNYAYMYPNFNILTRTTNFTNTELYKLLGKEDKFMDVSKYSGIQEKLNEYSYIKSNEIDSNGNKLSAQQSKFFKDSKIRDSQGNLLVMYHGTPNKFTIFDKSMFGENGGQWGYGIYLTPDYKTSLQYTGGVSDSMELYVNLKNPLMLYEKDVVGTLEDNGVDVDSYMKKQGVSHRMMLDTDAILSELGYDGVFDTESGLCVAFEPNQVKSVNNVNPTNRDDINESIVENSIDMSSEQDSEGNILTLEQAKYFSDSKVRDKSGRLLVCYHNSNADFDVFDKNKIRTGTFGNGFYFTTSERSAKAYGGKNTKKYYLDAKKVISIPTQYEDIHEFLLDRFGEDNIQVLIDRGYDGITTPMYYGDDEFDYYIVFEPNQIKSTSNKNPTSKDSINESVNSSVDNEGNTLSEEQLKYFRNTKVRDNKGNLLVCYHSTDDEFDEFDSSYSWDNFGFHFGTKEAAEDIGGEIMKSCYLNITNPLILKEDLQYWDAFSFIRLLYENPQLQKDIKIDGWEEIKQQYEEDLDYGDFDESFYFAEFGDVVRDALYNSKYDGIIYPNWAEDAGSTSYMCFYPEQIKYIDNKTPTRSKRMNESQNLSKQQEEFFKDSKIRKGGELIVCTHYSPSSFDSFDTSKIGDGYGMNFGKGFYFFVGDVESSSPQYGTNKYSCYLNVKNPFYYFNMNNKDKLIKFLNSSGYKYDKEFVDSYDYDNLIYNDDLIDDYLYYALVDADPYECFSDMVKQVGYDGIWADEEIVVFEPNQIKRITNENPTNSNNMNEGVYDDEEEDDVSEQIINEFLDVWDEFYHCSTEDILDLLEYTPSDKIDESSPMFILPNGKIVNVNDVLKQWRYKYPLVHHALPQVMAYIILKDICSSYGKQVEQFMYEEDSLLDKVTDEMINNLTYSKDWARINCGTSYVETRFYCVLPNYMKSAQYSALEEWLLWGEQNNRHEVLVFCGNEHQSQKYKFDELFTEGIMKKIKRFYSSGVLHEDTRVQKEFEPYTAGYILENGDLVILDEYHGEDATYRNKGLVEFSNTHNEDDTCIRVYKMPTKQQYERMEEIFQHYLDNEQYCKVEIWNSKTGYDFYEIFSLVEGACSDDSWNERVGNWSGYDLVKVIKNYYNNRRKIDEPLQEVLIYRGEGDNNYSVGRTPIAGLFYATDYDDASNFSDNVVKYNLKDGAKIYRGESSLNYCIENDLMNVWDKDLKNMLGVPTLIDMYEESSVPDGYFPKDEYLDDRPFFGTQLIAKKDLQKKGYDGAYWKWEDDLTPQQYQIWNMSVVEKVDQIKEDFSNIDKSEYLKFQSYVESIIDRKIKIVNKELDKFGFEVEYIDDYDFNENDQWIGVFYNEIQDAADVFPIAINIPFLYRECKKDKYLKDDLPYHIEKTIWHEVGHGIFEYLYDVFDLEDLDEEEVVEEYASYQVGDMNSPGDLLDCLYQYLENN